MLFQYYLKRQQNCNLGRLNSETRKNKSISFYFKKEIRLVALEKEILNNVPFIMTRQWKEKNIGQTNDNFHCKMNYIFSVN